MIGSIIAVFQVLACVGFGLAVLRGLRANTFETPLSEFAWAGVIGIGILGWLLYFVGIFGEYNPTVFISVLGLGCSGLAFFLRKPTVIPPTWRASSPLNIVGVILVILISVMFSLDVIEALAPPTDADSLAYHYAIPRQFLAAGKIIFVPRAVDGAVPLLVQMTYLPVLSLGGDQALTLWSMMSGYLTALLLFTLARRYMDTLWSLTLLLLFISTPAVIYGAGSGQVEVRNAAFVLVSAFALSQGISKSQIRWIIISGLAAGLFAGAKYSGLFFIASAGLTLLLFKPAFRYVIGFSSAALVAGCQWYLWNWFHTGDPVFPALFGFIPYKEPAFWDAAHNAFLQYRVTYGENSLPKTPLWAIAYPFIATFGADPILQGGRVGYGIAAFVLALPAAFALFANRHRIRHHPLLVVVSCGLIFYALWYFIGPSQRARHFLPIYPLILFGLIFTAQKWATHIERRRILGLTLIPVITMQLGVQFMYTSDAVAYQTKNMTKSAFLLDNISIFSPVVWINKNLPSDAHVLSSERQLEYFMKPKMFFYDVDQVLIDSLDPIKKPGVFWQQLRTQRITHVITRNTPTAQGNDVELSDKVWSLMTAYKCTKFIYRTPTRSISSRTLNIAAEKPSEAVILALTPDTCSLDESD